MWQETKKLLSAKMSESTFSLWIDPIRCLREDELVLELAGPDRFFCNWVKENYLASIRQILADLGRQEVVVSFKVRNASASSSKLLMNNRREQLHLPSVPKGRSYVRTLHPRYTFDEFMVGESNFLPHSACESLAGGDYSLGHCLYVEAGTGLGKSHLTHAVAHHIMSNSPEVRLHYLTAQQLTSELVQGIRNKTMDQFKEKYHNGCDVLLLEDVQIFSGKARTQEELGMALDILMDRGKRIIFTGSKLPRDIVDIDDSFRSRLSYGLVTTINPPDIRTRQLIIKRKAENSGLALDPEVIDYLAESIRGDVRQVESAIVGLKAKSGMLKKQPDLAMAGEIIAGIVGRIQELSARAICDFVAREFNVKKAEMCSRSRKKSVVFPRQVGMYLARKMTDQGLADIGAAFSRDHSTVVHSVRIITETIVRNASVRGQVALLTEKLEKQYF